MTERSGSDGPTTALCHSTADDVFVRGGSLFVGTMEGCGQLLARIAAAAREATGRALAPNATGTIAAILADCGVPVEILRGVALISRCAGLVGHIREEQRQPAMHALWQGAEAAVPYHAPEEDEP